MARLTSSGFSALLMPTDEPSSAGFTNTGDPSSLRIDARRAVGILAVLRAANDPPSRCGYPCRLKGALGDVLVHGKRRRQDAASHVRLAGDFEHTLDGSVLTVRTVQNREHHVVVDGVVSNEQPAVWQAQGSRTALGAEGSVRRIDDPPGAVSVDSDRDYAVTGLDEGVVDRHGRNTRDLVLG